jgi:hypothetical protein
MNAYPEADVAPSCESAYRQNRLKYNRLYHQHFAAREHSLPAHEICGKDMRVEMRHEGGDAI